MSLDDMEHQHTPDEERRIREAALDQTIEGSFPASDPPSSNPNPDDHSALEHQDPQEEQPNTDKRRLAVNRGQSFARPISFVPSLSHNTQLATAIQNVQSRAVNPTVPKARWRKGT